MIIRDITNSPHERVLDRSLLCELLHPDKVAGAQELGCSIAHAIIPPGESTLPHLLKKSTELYYILDGLGEMHIDKKSAQVSPGSDHPDSPTSPPVDPEYRQGESGLPLYRLAKVAGEG